MIKLTEIIADKITVDNLLRKIIAYINSLPHDERHARMEINLAAVLRKIKPIQRLKVQPTTTEWLVDLNRRQLKQLYKELLDFEKQNYIERD